MKFLFDLFPVALFFIIFKVASGNEAAAAAFVTQHMSWLISGGQIKASLAPIILSTAVAILASVAQIGYLLIRRKKVDVMLWVSFAIILVFGGATIYFHDDTFIKWKPTVLYWAFATVMLVAQWGFRKNLIRAGMEKQITLPEPVWTKLSLAWIAFFIFMGALNIYVFSNFSTETWVSFKAFGGMGLMFVFVIGQSLYLSRYLKEAP